MIRALSAVPVLFRLQRASREPRWRANRRNGELAACGEELRSPTEHRIECWLSVRPAARLSPYRFDYNMRRRFHMASGKGSLKTAKPAAVTKRVRARPATSARRTEKMVETAPRRPDRLLPAADLPDYTYVPGTSTPHPIRDPRGHSHSRKGRTSFPLTAENWADSRTFLLRSTFSTPAITGKPTGVGTPVASPDPIQRWAAFCAA